MLRTATGRSESGVTWQALPLNACITTFSPSECMLISESKSTLVPCRLGVCAEAVSPTRNTKAVKVLVFIRPPPAQNGAISHFGQITSVILLQPSSSHALQRCYLCQLPAGRKTHWISLFNVEVRADKQPLSLLIGRR